MESLNSFMWLLSQQPWGPAHLQVISASPQVLKAQRKPYKIPCHSYWTHTCWCWTLAEMFCFSNSIRGWSQGQRSWCLFPQVSSTALLLGGWMDTHPALRYSTMSLRKASPACADSFCVQARCSAPLRHFDLWTRCSTETITICMGVACDKNKSIPNRCSPKHTHFCPAGQVLCCLCAVTTSTTRCDRTVPAADWTEH